MDKQIKADISVVIPVYNEEKLLPLCIKSLKNQDFFGKYEVIFVDNNSTDNSKKIIKDSGFKYVFAKEKGIAHARQAGFAQANSDIIASTDSDTLVASNWLTKIYQTFQENPDVVGLTGSIDLYGHTKNRLTIYNIVGPVARKITWLLSLGKHFWGANFAIKKEIFEKIGGFDTRLVAGEDHDLGEHAREFGKIVYRSDVQVTTSARKFERSISTKNVCQTINIYSLNFFWLLFFKKPKIKEYEDTRTTTESYNIYKKEWLMILRTTTIVIFCLLLIICIFFNGVISPKSQLFGKAYWKQKTTDKIVALTFDDGPNEPYTSQILDILKDNNIKATFFVLGENVNYYPDIAQRIVNEGHVIANHSYSHQQDLVIEKQTSIDKEINWTQDIIFNTTGKIPQLFRPPHGYKSPWLITKLKENNLTLVEWSNMTNDWDQPGSKKITDKIIKKTHPGSIIVLHDGNKTIHGSDRSDEVEALPNIIKNLQEKGYRFVTVPILFNISAYKN